jgi:hypothetical protein
MQLRHQPDHDAAVDAGDLRIIRLGGLRRGQINAFGRGLNQDGSTKNRPKSTTSSTSAGARYRLVAACMMFMAGLNR